MPYLYDGQGHRRRSECPRDCLSQSPLELIARLVCVSEWSVKLSLRAPAECPHLRAVDLRRSPRSWYRIEEKPGCIPQWQWPPYLEKDLLSERAWRSLF